MPLIKSGSKKARQENIKEMIASGHPPRQAVAASYSNQRKYSKKGNSMKKSDSMSHPGHQMNLETHHEGLYGGNSDYKHDTSSKIKGTHNMPAQHHDKAHPAGPKHPSIHSFHNIGHRDHNSKMSEG